jgi:hypothetical protein
MENQPPTKTSRRMKKESGSWSEQNTSNTEKSQGDDYV